MRDHHAIDHRVVHQRQEAVAQRPLPLDRHVRSGKAPPLLDAQLRHVLDAARRRHDLVRT
ncbi:MAG: hypothetical protein U0164_08455 [Gemmatimonadaceae bacterium]